MERRVIVAVVLSLMVLLMWQRFIGEQQAAIEQPTAEGRRPVVTGTTPATSGQVTQQALVETPEVQSVPQVIESSQFVVTFDKIGGCIRSIALKEYYEESLKGYYPLASVPGVALGMLSIVSPQLFAGEDVARYAITEGNGMVRCEAVYPDDIKIIKSYTFNTKDAIGLDLTFENVGSAMKVFQYDIRGGSCIEDEHHFAERYIQVDASVNGSIVRNRSVRNSAIVHSGNVEWVALKNKYFALVLKPFAASSGSLVLKNKDNKLAAGIKMSSLSLQPGARVTHSFVMYAGPKKPERLAALNYRFEDVIHFGIFGGISRSLLTILSFFHRITDNWGASIILLAMLINTILYPLTRQSLKSMRAMQAIQPEIKTLQDKYKKNPQKLNKEIMELYKKYKVNPFGGCLPLLLQMPIFISLYQGLIKFIELKNARFLWITDLSLPDSVAVPFIAGKSIHVLPILMAGTMFLQQKFSHPQHQAGLSEQQRQQQQIMAVMMPLLFGFIFYNFPSGLVLYWFTNTLFMTFHQFLALKKAM